MKPALSSTWAVTGRLRWQPYTELGAVGTDLQQEWVCRETGEHKWKPVPWVASEVRPIPANKLEEANQ